MNTTDVHFRENGRNPRLVDSRLTVMDVFYYLRRGRDFDCIQRAMTTLTREQFDAVVEYVNNHHDELVEMDNQVEERNRREMAEQEAKGIRRPVDPSIPLEERVEALRAKLRSRKAALAERNGDHSAR